MAPSVEQLPSMHGALGVIPSTSEMVQGSVPPRAGRQGHLEQH